MRAVGRAVAKIELEKVVAESPESYGAHVRLFCDGRGVVGIQLLEEVCFARGKLFNQRRRIGREGPDHTVQLGPWPAVRFAPGYFKTNLLLPVHQLE